MVQFVLRKFFNPIDISYFMFAYTLDPVHLLMEKLKQLEIKVHLAIKSIFNKNNPPLPRLKSIPLKTSE